MSYFIRPSDTKNSMVLSLERNNKNNRTKQKCVDSEGSVIQRSQTESEEFLFFQRNAVVFCTNLASDVSSLAAYPSKDRALHKKIQPHENTFLKTCQRDSLNI